jgi:hypothetical protein
VVRLRLVFPLFLAFLACLAAPVAPVVRRFPALPASLVDRTGQLDPHHLSDPADQPRLMVPVDPCDQATLLA